MKKIDLTNVSENTDRAKLIPGGYICKILQAQDVPLADNGKGDYLKIDFDIAEGKFKDYFNNLYELFGSWPYEGSFIKSYKEKALPFFKGFITAIENSNPKYKWKDDEKTLSGKLIGLVLGEEEYISKDGEVKSKLYVSDVRSVDKIKSGDFKVQILKSLQNKFAQSSKEDDFIKLDDDAELPF